MIPVISDPRTISRKVSPAVLAILLLSLWQAGCARQQHPTLARYDVTVTPVSGTAFEHFYAGYGPVTRSTTLNVYLEGDGRPFTGRDRVSLDPTPARSLMLELMRRDPDAAVYLSRPCYFELPDPRCEPRDWTTGRYSEDVVASLASALETITARYGATRVRLIGHSGGGTLAVLLAPRLASVRTVVTLAGNLDIERWAEWHDYSPLGSSLNPATRPPAGSARELHFLAENDAVVPRETAHRYLFDEERHRKPFDICLLRGCGHENCWRRDWEKILAMINDASIPCESIERGVHLSQGK